MVYDKLGHSLYVLILGCSQTQILEFCLIFAGLRYGLGVSNLHKMISGWYVAASSLEIEK